MSAYNCDLCGKEFRTIDHRRFCTVGCEVGWWNGNEALEENEKLRAALAASEQRVMELEDERFTQQDSKRMLESARLRFDWQNANHAAIERRAQKAEALASERLERIGVLEEALRETCPDCGFGRPVRADGYHLQLPSEVEHGTSAPAVVGKCRLTPRLRDALSPTKPTEVERKCAQCGEYHGIAPCSGPSNEGRESDG